MEHFYERGEEILNWKNRGSTKRKDEEDLRPLSKKGTY